MAEIVGTITNLSDFLSKTQVCLSVKPNDPQQQIICLEADRKYSIPAFQREVRWDDNNLKMLLYDLSRSSKFLGNIILTIKSDHTCEIIDGQQRTTVLMLIVSCIKKKFGTKISTPDLCPLRNEGFTGFQTLLEKAFDQEAITSDDWNAILKSDDYLQLPRIQKLWNTISSSELLADRHKAQGLLDNLCKSEFNIIASYSNDVNTSIQYFLDVNLKGIRLDTEDIFKGYEFKVNYARIRAWEFYNECGKRDLDCYVSVGGLDSITLFFFLKSIGIDVPAVSVSSLEDVSIQKIHKQIGVISLPPAVRADGTRWNKQKLIQEFGFPVLSKEIARKIELLQNPTPNNKTIRHAIVTGETGEYGGFQKHSKMKLAQKWLEKFGGLENEEEGVNYQIAPFKVSSKCCYYLKEKPCSDWAKEHNCVPYLGLMASEGGRREKSLMLNGCNYFGKGTIRSAPFAIFNRQDLLQLALDLKVPVPEIYGSILKDEDGHLYTSGEQRTGCSMCGFGIQLEKRPHRFDRLRERNYKEWDFWMNRCCFDENGTPYGWGKILDYLGIGWRDIPDPHNRKK